MSTRDAILREIDRIPEPVLLEILDFARFVKDRAVREQFETAIASQPVLAADWLKPEEDAAWQDL